MVRDVRIKQYIFSPSDLTVNAAGSGTVYSDHTVNGTVHNVVLLNNNYTTTGSILIFASGLSNSGTALGELIITLRAGSLNRAYYPIVYGDTNQAGTGSPQAFTNPIIHAPIRLAFSGCGNATSGVGLIINYI